MPIDMFERAQEITREHAAKIAKRCDLLSDLENRETKPAESEGEGKRRSLGELLQILSLADSALHTTFTDEDIEELRDKVDAYKYISDKYESEISRLNEQAKQITEVKRSLENQYAKLREQMAFHMLTNGFQKLPGQKYQVSLVEKEEVDLKLPECNSQSYLDHGAELVKRTYAWSVSGLKKAVKGNPEGYKQFGSVIKKHHIAFSVRKNIDE